MATTLATEKQAEAIKQRMAEIRTELPYKADIARDRVKQLADWRYHMSRQPLPILAAVLVAGYLIVPSKRMPERIVVERTAPSDGSVAPAKKGLVGGIAGAVATLATKEATSLVASQLNNLLSRRGVS